VVTDLHACNLWLLGTGFCIRVGFQASKEFVYFTLDIFVVQGYVPAGKFVFTFLQPLDVMDITA